MAKSIIIKDIANSTIDLITALKRAKLLFSALGSTELLNWVNYEISGYPLDAVVPDYRIERGTLMGTYVRGIPSSLATFKDVSIPLGKMPVNEMDELLNVPFFDGVSSLEQLVGISDNGKLARTIPADLFPFLTRYTNDPYMRIISARVVVSTHCITNMFSVIENRLLDALLVLEKEFGVLDDLDIDVAAKSPEEIQAIVKEVYVIFYNDQSVNIGDGNKIKGTSISTGNEGMA